MSDKGEFYLSHNCFMLDPGKHKIRVEAVEITGEELMHLRKIFLQPISIPAKP